MIDNGIFSLKTPEQLFRKLVRDYEHVKKNQLDSDGWFNFFVTADHLPEWESNADQVAAGKLRDQEPLLRICNHLSRNAKHFRAIDMRLRRGEILINAVAQTNIGYVVTLGGGLQGVMPGSPPARPVSDSTNRQTPQEFMMLLSPKEASELGLSEIAALELARRVVEFWRVRLTLP